MTISFFSIHRSQARKVVFSVGVALIGTLSSGLGTELVNGGDLGSLELWDPPSVRSPAGREIIEENSPFDEVYPSNGRCLKLVDAVGLIHLVYLKQQISTGTGKLIWSFDYKQLENDLQDRDGGFGVQLTSGGKVLLGMRVRDDFSGNIKKGDLGTGSHQVSSKLLARGVWYHFRGEIDLETQTMSWTLTSDQGDFFEFPRGEISSQGVEDTSMIDGIMIRANNGGGPTCSQPILFDNLSVQQLP